MESRHDAMCKIAHQLIHSAADKSSRYVAEENITPLSGPPPQSLLRLAGRFFKRWDEAAGRFASNMQDEYPHD